MNTWIWIGVAVLAGLAVGAALAAWYFRRQRADAKTISELQAELDDYKHEVTEHFVQTAELVNNMTRSYKAVYDHLEHGAYRLIGEETLRKELGYVDSEPVKLEYIGRRDRAAVLGPAADTERNETIEPGAVTKPFASAHTTLGGSKATAAASSSDETGRTDAEQQASGQQPSEQPGSKQHDLQRQRSEQQRLEQQRLERERPDPASEEDTGPVR